MLEEVHLRCPDTRGRSWDGGSICSAMLICQTLVARLCQPQVEVRFRSMADVAAINGAQFCQCTARAERMGGAVPGIARLAAGQRGPGAGAVRALVEARRVGGSTAKELLRAAARLP
jgi:hypothetical protein